MDDDDVARRITRNLCRLRSFSGGNSVLSEALRQSPALFLLDIMLPGVDGFELCRQIRQTGSLSGKPIVFLTAKAPNPADSKNERRQHDNRADAVNSGATVGNSEQR